MIGEYDVKNCLIHPCQTSVSTNEQIFFNRTEIILHGKKLISMQLSYSVINQYSYHNRWALPIFVCFSRWKNTKAQLTGSWDYK